MRQPLATFLVISMIVMLGSCSSSQPQPEPEVHFANIALISVREALDATQPQTRGDRTQEGVEKGGVAGAAGGVAVGAIACGPFYSLCMMAGLLAGSATGALYGFTGFPKNVAIELERNVEALSREHDLQSELVYHIRQQVAPEMLAEPDAAEIQAVLIIENLNFVTEGGKVHLVSTVRASFESTEPRRVPQYGSRVFKGQSGEFELKNWLDTSSGDLEEAVRQSLLDVSGKIVTVLNDRWKPATDSRSQVKAGVTPD